MDWMQLVRLASMFGGDGPVTSQLPWQRTQEDIWTNGGFDPKTGVIIDNWGGPRPNPTNAAPNPVQANPAPMYPKEAGNPQQFQGDGVLPPVQPGFGQQEEDPYDKILGMYKPDTRAQDMLYQMLENFPQREKPSWGRRLLGAFAGGVNQNYNLGREVIDHPYNQQLQDYMMRMEPLKILAGMERGDNSNERAWALGLLRDRIAERRADIAQQRAESYGKYQEGRLDIEKQKLEIARYLAMHPNMLPQRDMKTGKLILVNPKTGETVVTNIEHGQLSDFDLENMRQDNRIELEETRQTGRESIEDIRQENRESTQDLRAWELGTITMPDGKQKSVRINKITGEVKDVDTGGGIIAKPGTNKPGQANKPEVPSQQTQRMINNATALINRRPELKEWIEFNGPNGRPRLKPNRGWGRELPEDEKARINAVINHGVDIAPVRSNNAGAKATEAKPASPIAKGTGINQPPGKIKVVAPNGQVGFIPFEQWPAAEKQGYKKAY